MIRARKQTAANPPETIKPATEQPSSPSMERLRLERLKKYRLTNQRLAIELKRLRGQVGDIEALKSEVIRANGIVKAQLLGIPFRIAPHLVDVTDPAECARIVEQAIVGCLNDLAHGIPAEDGTCPCCGRRKEEEK